MGLFGSSKDWNVIAVIYERDQLYRINGNRSKGKMAAKTRDGAKNHGRTIYWAVFDQKGAFLEGDFGPGINYITSSGVSPDRLKKEIPTNKSVLDILRMLEKGEKEKAAKPLVWGGYPEAESA